MKEVPVIMKTNGVVIEKEVQLNIKCTHPEFVLSPDYAPADAVWCASCGSRIVLSKYAIPEGLISMIEIWNSDWDYNSIRNTWSRDSCERRILKAGKYLAELVNNYHPCEFDEEGSKLDGSNIDEKKKRS